MRARYIKPGFFENEGLPKLAPHARLLFIGLWLLADREGRLEDRPKKIEGQIFPHEEVDVDELLESLGKITDGNGAFIERYQIGDRKYIQVNTFVRHQTPHKNEKPSEIPAPGKGQKDTPVITGVTQEITGVTPVKAVPIELNEIELNENKGKKSAEEKTKTLTPLSEFLSIQGQRPESKTEPSPSGRQTPENPDDSVKTEPTSTSEEPNPEEDPNFAIFWTYCPKQVGKKEAAREFRALMKEQVNPDWLFNRIRDYTANAAPGEEVLSPAAFLRSCSDKKRVDVDEIAAADPPDVPGGLEPFDSIVGRMKSGKKAET